MNDDGFWTEAGMIVAGLLAALLALSVVLTLIWIPISGLGQVRHESQYTGEVVDIENQKGMIMQTTQVHMKTNPRASSHETFCVHPDNREQLDPLRSALRDSERVTITYSRPLYVAPWTCKSGTSIIREIDRSGNETGGE